MINIFLSRKILTNHDKKGKNMAERRSKKRGRRRTDRESFNTSLSPDLIEMLQDLSEKTGIPMNRLIENALREKYAEYLRRNR